MDFKHGGHSNYANICILFKGDYGLRAPIFALGVYMATLDNLKGSEGRRITKETANEYRLKGLEVRRRLQEQRVVWESQAKLTPEENEFFEMLGFTGDRKKAIDNKYKLIYPALRKAYEKGKFDQIAKFFEMVGVTWSSDMPMFMSAYNATIKSDEDEVKREPIEVHIKRLSDGG